MFNRSLSSLLSSMTKMVARLEAHANDATAKAIAKRRAADELHIEADGYVEEARRADRVASRVKDLLV